MEAGMSSGAAYDISYGDGSFGLPGRGGNGSGSLGVYYDWQSNTYRSTTGYNQVGWQQVYSEVILPNSITVPFEDIVCSEEVPGVKISGKAILPSYTILVNCLYSFFKAFIYIDKVNLIYDDDKVKAQRIIKEKKIIAYCETTPDAKGNYNVVFSNDAFSSPFMLYLVMGHELNHVAHLINGLYNTPYSEYAAYTWMYLVSQDNRYKDQANGYRKEIDEIGSFNDPTYQKYNQWGIWGLYHVVPKGIY